MNFVKKNHHHFYLSSLTEKNSKQHQTCWMICIIITHMERH